MNATPADTSRIHNQLQPGEQLLWSAKPAIQWCNRETWLFIVLGNGLILTGLYMLAAMRSWESLCIATPLVLVGLGCSVLWPYLHAARRRQWAYAITDRRVLLLLHRGLREYKLTPAMVIDCELRHDRLGKLVFERIPFLYYGDYEEWGFLNLPDAREPLSILNRLLLQQALSPTAAEKALKLAKQTTPLRLAQRPWLALLGIAGLMLLAMLAMLSVLRQLNITLSASPADLWEPLLNCLVSAALLGLLLRLAIRRATLFSHGLQMLHPRGSKRPSASDSKQGTR